MANLLRLIQKMNPKYVPGVKMKKKKKKKGKEEEEIKIKEEPPEENKDDLELKRKLYPGLAMPDNPNVAVCIIVYCNLRGCNC